MRIRRRGRYAFRSRLHRGHFPELGRFLRGACAELDIHHGVLIELHLAAAGDYARIHRPRQSVVTESHADVAGRLRQSGAQHAEAQAAAQELAERGVQVTFLPCTPQGVVEVSALEAALRPKSGPPPHTRLVSVMLANNERSEEHTSELQ